MPFSYVVDAGRRRVTISGSGAGTYDDILAIVAEVTSDDHVAPRFSVLLDFQHVRIRFGDGERAELGDLLGRLRSRFTGRIALVRVGVGERTGAELLALTASLHGLQMRAFGDLGEAEQWLNDARAGD